ncbi:hypothetical protein AAFF_G00439810 [Aldrovandia affinis]|uniref:Uncharacterized protein n=1 Tax=Aldrovandia affinis TaxID=143900 RepID=A0AAD7S831_9TELE|nr:hypothetical protein AAFF_G00439810 [Aldrovandia affinis]
MQECIIRCAVVRLDPPFRVWGLVMMLPPIGGTSSTICRMIPVDSRYWKYRICNDWILHTVELYDVRNIRTVGHNSSQPYSGRFGHKPLSALYSKPSGGIWSRVRCEQHLWFLFRVTFS